MRSLKILFVGNFEVDYSSENHHKKSLEALGHTVTWLQEGKASGEQILDIGLTQDFVVFVHTHGWVTPGRPLQEVFQMLNHYNTPVITYHLDLWFGLERQKDIMDDPFYTSIGHFFATDKLMCDWFNENTKVKGHFIPAGVFHEEVVMMDNDDRITNRNDVIFVGSKGYHPEYPYRPILVDFLRGTFKDRFLHVGGDGDTGTIRGLALNATYRNSKVAIGDSLNIGFEYPYYTSDRLFESTGRGGFTIYPRIKGLDEYFEDGKEIVFYEHGNLHDLQKKINYYLEHDDERETIRKAGFERTKKDHTYIKRWETIIEELAKWNERLS